MCHLQPHYRRNKRDDEEQTPERGRLPEHQNAHQHRTCRPYARPHGIGRADRYGVDGAREQRHAERKTQQEAGAPQPVLRAGCIFHLTQTEGEARLEQARHD